MESLPLVSSLNNENLTAYPQTKVTFEELWVSDRRMWNPVDPETKGLLRRQAHARVTGSLPVVSYTDPETAPSSCRITYRLVWSWFCHQQQMLGALQESYSPKPQVTSPRPPALVPVVDREVAWGLMPPLLATSHTIILPQGLFSRHIFPAEAGFPTLVQLAILKQPYILARIDQRLRMLLGIFQEMLPSEPQR